mgnify:CR=1 FL=1
MKNLLENPKLIHTYAKQIRTASETGQPVCVESYIGDDYPSFNRSEYRDENGEQVYLGDEDEVAVLHKIYAFPDGTLRKIVVPVDWKEYEEENSMPQVDWRDVLAVHGFSAADYSI